MSDIILENFRTPIKQEFMKKFRRWEPKVQDHSSTIVAKRCFREYFYRVVLGFVPKESPQYFGFGSCYHKFREVLEKEYLRRAKEEEDIKSDAAQMEMFALGVAAARAMWKRKKMRNPIAGDKWDFLTEERLVSSCAVAFKHWQREKAAGRIQVLTVEQNFIVPLPDGTYVGGKADQIIRWNNKVWGRDFKTSSKEQNAFFTRTLEPNDQFMRYTWAEAQLAGTEVQGQLVEVLFNAKGTKKAPQKGPEIHPHIAARTSAQIEQWVKEQVHFERILNLCREEDIWPMEEANCSFCIFHSVCKGSSERAQMAKLEAEFKIEPWDCTNRVDD